MSNALLVAWAITNNENIAVYYLVKRHSNRNAPNKIDARELALFASL